jgi:hypothetical protein
MGNPRATGIKTLYTTRDLYEQGRTATADYETAVQPLRTQRLTPLDIPAGESIKQGLLDTPSAVMTFVSAAPIASETAAAAVVRRPETAPALFLLGLGLQVEAAKQDPVRFAVPMLVPAGIGRASRVGRVSRQPLLPQQKPPTPSSPRPRFPASGFPVTDVRFTVSVLHGRDLASRVRGSLTDDRCHGSSAPMAEPATGVRGSRLLTIDSRDSVLHVRDLLPVVRGSRYRLRCQGQRAPMAETSLPASGVPGTYDRMSRVSVPRCRDPHPRCQGFSSRTFDIEAAAEVGGVTVEFAQLGLFRKPVTTGRTRTIDIPEQFRDTYGGARQIRVPEYGFEWTRAPAPERAIFGTGRGSGSTSALGTETSLSPATAASRTTPATAQAVISADILAFGTDPGTRTLPDSRDITGIDFGTLPLSAQNEVLSHLSAPRTTTRQQIDISSRPLEMPRSARIAPTFPGRDPPRFNHPDNDTPTPKKKRKKGGRGSKAETAFWENLRVATPREFLGLPPSPRKKPAKRRKR